MIGFSDDELITIAELAVPLPHCMCSDFLELVANRIEECSELERGLGLIHRVAVEAFNK
jgi:hypothetical protein